MGKSWRKPYGHPKVSCNEWKRTYNRALRSRIKQKLRTCRDYDSLIIPTKKEVGSKYDSPYDGNKWLEETPYINDCEVRMSKYIHEGWRVHWYDKCFKNGHFKLYGGFPSCNCYGNKRSWYWKMCRK